MKIELCPKCGLFLLTFKTGKPCPVCGSDNLILDEEKDCPKFATMSWEERERFAIDYLGHGFDPDLKEKRIYWRQHQYDSVNKKIDRRTKPVVTCPYCKSTDTKKISATSRVVSTGLFGLGSKKIGKQWHCNRCKTDF